MSQTAAGPPPHPRSCRNRVPACPYILFNPGMVVAGFAGAVGTAIDSPHVGLLQRHSIGVFLRSG
jgi:hypothetical protein